MTYVPPDPLRPIAVEPLIPPLRWRVSPASIRLQYSTTTPVYDDRGRTVDSVIEWTDVPEETFPS